MTHDTIAAIREALCEVGAQLGRYIDGGYISQKVWYNLHAKISSVHREIDKAAGIGKNAERGIGHE